VAKGADVGDNATIENSAAGMAGFLGQFVHALDGKKRLTIPSEWRDLTGAPAQLVVLPSVTVDKCLWVYPMREWNLRIGKIRAVSSADEEKRRALRVLASQSEMLTWDGVGRMRVKDELLNFAGLSGQVVLVGAFERFELWEPELWKQQVGSVDQVSLQRAVQSVGL